MRTALIGRDTELARLCDALDAALAGRPGVVLCRGEPGIGKTRLAEELSGRARQRGALVAWGSGVESAGAPPFWPWVQVLRARSDRVDLAALAAGSGPTTDLAGLAPDVFGTASPPAADGGGEARFRQFDAVARLLRDASREGPLLIVLDDAHWADRPSVLLTRHLARTLAGARVLLVVTARSTETEHATDFAELLREPVTQQVELTGLPPAAVAEQLAALTGQRIDGAEAGQVHALTGGNPFFATEVGRVLPARRVGGGIVPVTANVRDAIAARLGRLSPGCVRLLRAASIVGRDVPLSVLAAVLNVAPGDCLEPLDEARTAGMVEVGELPGHQRFVHALIRDAIEAGLSSSERVRLHRRAAEVLEAQSGRPRPPHLFDLARHWAVAAIGGEQLRAVPWIGRAADAALRGLAHEESARLYQLALSIGHGHLDPEAECQLTLGLARALHLCGDDAGGLEARLTAAALARDAERPDLLAQAALAADAVGPTATEEPTRRLCRETLAALPADAVALRAQVTARYAEACVYTAWVTEHALDDYEEAAAASTDALTLAEQCGDRTALRAALRARRMACSAPEGLDERERLAERMLALGRESADTRAQLWARLWRIDAAFERGDLPLVTRELEALARCVEQVRGPHARFELLRCQAVLAQAQGRFGDAMDLAARAFTEISVTGEFGYQERAGLHHQIGLHIGHKASGAVEAGGFANATVFERPLQTAGIIIAVANAHMLASAGRLDEASAVYRSLGPPGAWQPSPHAVLPALAFGVNLAIMLGTDDDLALLRARLARYRGHHVVSGAGQVAYFGPVELWLGNGAARLGLLDEAVTDLEHAVRATAANGAAGYRVEAACLLAATLIQRARPGDVPRARTLLESVADRAAALGMTPFAARAEQLRRQLAASGPLTRREWEVAELVAQGTTNREIAARLYLSERTAQNHVQHILTKLGLANRSQITAWMARQDR